MYRIKQPARRVGMYRTPLSHRGVLRSASYAAAAIITTAVMIAGCCGTTPLPPKYHTLGAASRDIVLFSGSDSTVGSALSTPDGMVRIIDGGTLQYTPRTDWYGTDCISYTATVWKEGKISSENLPGVVRVNRDLPNVRSITVKVANRGAERMRGSLTVVLIEGGDRIIGSAMVPGGAAPQREISMAITPAGVCNVSTLTSLQAVVTYVPADTDDIAKLGITAIAQLDNGSAVQVLASDGAQEFNPNSPRASIASGYRPRILDCPTKTVEDVVDSNMFIAAAVKTVYGKAPDAEFFDLFARFRMPFSQYAFSIVTFDIPLAAANDTSSSAVRAIARTLGEASGSLNFVIAGHGAQRQLFFGGEFRIFGGEPYYGFQFGAIEARGLFLGSHLTFSLLRRLYPMDARTIHTLDSVQSATAEPAALGTIQPVSYDNNLLVNFAFHSEHLTLLKLLRVKAGVLFPLPLSWMSQERRIEPNTRDVQFRVALEVPVDGVHVF